MVEYPFVRELLIKLFALIACLALSWGQAGHAQAAALEQQWTRQIAKGVTYNHLRVRLKQGPAHLHILEISPGGGYTIRPVIANGRIGSLAPVSKLAQEHGAVAAINGGFFDTGSSHLPVGLIKINNHTIFEQFLPRPVLGIDANGSLHFATFTLHSRIFLPEAGTTLPLFGYNRQRKAGEIIAYSQDFGARTRTNEWGLEIKLIRLSAEEARTGVENFIGERYLVTGESPSNTLIGKDELVLSFHSSAIRKYAPQLKTLYPGAEIEVRTNVPAGWEKFPHLLGGGPVLVKDGNYALNYRAERFSGGMNSPTARTAVGKTRSGSVMLVVVDAGSKDYSVGATWQQLAVLGKDLLCLTDFMGFDGGGSSTMYVDNRVVNQPKGGAPRSVSNIIAVVRKGRG